MTKRLLAGILTSLLSFVTGVTISLANSACGIGDGTVIDGGRGYHFIACKSGSILIVRSTEAYPTAKKANRVFEDRLQKATTVIQRNQKSASKGKQLDSAPLQRSRTCKLVSHSRQYFGLTTDS